ncbi:uncharacterized protein TNCT_412341 [Trichonephila clavata]|nr:uncharacterized protein TNCT_412341 [Trichonephila clavata]
MDVMQKLLQSGADINCQNHLGESPLHIAAQCSDGVVLGLLAKGGSCINIENKDGHTPLHLAVSSNCKDFVEILLQNGANINAIGKDGCTPLHLAVMKGNKEIVELLLDRKANAHLKCFYNSEEGYTALENAVANRNKKIVALFLLHGIILERIYKNLVRKAPLRESEKKTEYNFDDIQVYKENPEIVAIAKPVGKWTKMAILNNELMQRLARLIQEEGDEKGYWELFVKAQSSTQGKYKGRGR